MESFIFVLISLFYKKEFHLLMNNFLQKGPASLMNVLVQDDFIFFREEDMISLNSSIFVF